MSLITDRLLTGPYYGLPKGHFVAIPLNRSLLPSNFEFMSDIAKQRFLLEFSALQWILMGQTPVYEFDGDQETELSEVDLNGQFKIKIDAWREQRLEDYGEDTIMFPVHELVYKAYKDLSERGYGHFCEDNLARSFYLLEYEYEHEYLFRIGEVDYGNGYDGQLVVAPLDKALRLAIEVNHGRGSLYEFIDPPII